jgi:hypothetical protein
MYSKHFLNQGYMILEPKEECSRKQKQAFCSQPN